MGAADNLAIHTTWTDAENRHDLTSLGDFLHDDIEVNMPGSERVVGIDGYRAMMEEMFAGLDGFHVVLDDQFATDDRVVCRWRMSGTHNGDFYGIPATGKHLEFPGISLWEFENGKARRGWAMPDAAALMTQLAE